MKIKKFISVFFSIILICTSLPFSSLGAESTAVSASSYASGRVIFKYSPSSVCAASIDMNDAGQDGKITEDDIGTAFKKCGVTQAKLISSFSSSKDENSISIQSVEESDGGVYVADIDGDVTEACKKLKKISGVEYAEPDYFMQTDSVTMPQEVTLPTEKYLNYQKTYMENVLHLPEAWQNYDTLGAGVTVAVLDTGIDTSLTEIHDNLWTDGNGHYGYNAYTSGYDISYDKKVTLKDTDNNPDTPDEEVTEYYTHGLNTTGIVGMIANGSMGVGAAPESTVMAIKVSYVDGDGNLFVSMDTVIAGINFAVNNGADIISCSIGSYTNSQALTDACTAATNNGVLIFASAGNDSASTSSGYIRYPAGLSCVVGVMATDGNGYISKFPSGAFSNYDDVGGIYDIAAPGNAIIGLGMSNDTVSVAYGTSQATPLTASIAALYKSKYPSCTVDELKEAICNYSTSYCTVQTEEGTCSKKFSIVNATEVLSSPENKPVVAAVAGTTAYVDNNKNYIYGIDEKYSDIASYIKVTDGTYTFEPTVNGNGTGSEVHVYNKYGACCKTYYIVIFGDADGDAVCDGCDVVYIERILDGYNVTGILPCISFAMDVDFDDSVSDSDKQIISNYAIGLDFVSQIR